MIECLHEHYFYYPDGSKKCYFRMKKPSTKKIIIQHPYLLFDPQNNQIYREEYKLKYQNNDLIINFITLSESNAELREDEYLWYHTGYWSILDKRYLYIGSGEYGILDTIKYVQKGKLAFCLSFRDFIIFIKSTFSQGQIKNESIIDIYCTNSYLPFVEVLNPFRKSLKMMGKFYLNKTEKLDYSSIKVDSQYKSLLSFVDYSFSLKNRKNIMIPYAIVPVGERGIGPVVVLNDFGPFPIDSINSLGYIFTQMIGGCLKSDFFRPGDFYYIGSIDIYNDIILLNGYFDYGEFNNEVEPFLENNFEIEKTYLDYFNY